MKTATRGPKGKDDARSVALMKKFRADPKLAPIIDAFEQGKAVARGRKFGANALEVNGKLFALFTQGTLVIKLPKDRVATLVASHVGEPFDPGHGRLMKEWLTVTSSKASWFELAKEAHDFVSGVASSRVCTSGPLADIPPAVSPIIEALRKTVRTVAPEAAEVACAGQRPRSPSMMWKLTRYLMSGKVVVTIGTFTKHSSMFFARGSELDDGSGLLQGTGKNLRYITLRTPADAKRAAVKKLLREAFALAARSAPDASA